jgi:hypothetical protein
MESTTQLPWVTTKPKSCYFWTEDGNPWTPIGQNEAISWLKLRSLYDRADVPAVEEYLQMLKQSGVNCIRMALEYWDEEWFNFETKLGEFNPTLVTFWDDLISMCERYEIRIVLTPFNGYWLRREWDTHPYNIENGGICKDWSEILVNPDARTAIKQRFKFCTERWSHSGAIVGWSVWNSIHPMFSSNDVPAIKSYVDEMLDYIVELEKQLFGKRHVHTASVLNALINREVAERKNIYPHIVKQFQEMTLGNPKLDFISILMYDEISLDDPKDTVEGPLAMARNLCQAICQNKNYRPVIAAEYGPIHAFKDKEVILPEYFDNEYYRHVTWAHFAAGGAGSGFRWPARHPHCLTTGMHFAQKNLSKFLKYIDFKDFRRENLNEEIKVSDINVGVCACGNRKEALLWLVRKDKMNTDGMVDPHVDTLKFDVEIPNLYPGKYQVVIFNTREGKAVRMFTQSKLPKENMNIKVRDLDSDLALLVKFIPE